MGTVPSPCRLYSYSKSPSRSATPVAVVRLQPTTMLKRASAGAMRCSSPAAARSSAASGPGPFGRPRRGVEQVEVADAALLAGSSSCRPGKLANTLRARNSASCRRSSIAILRTTEYVPRSACTAASDPEFGVPSMIELRDLFAGGMRERGARHQPAHAVADQRDVVAAVGRDAFGEQFAERGDVAAPVVVEQHRIEPGLAQATA